MKIVVTKDNLKKVLNLVSHVVGHTSTLPILSNILMQTDKGRIKISATNLEIGLTAWVGGRVEEEGGATLPARTITDYVSTTLGDQVTLAKDKEGLTVSTDVSRATLKTLPPDEFPLIPQLTVGGQIDLPADELKGAFNETIFAAAPLETQPELSGVYVFLDNEKLYFVATDRYRLTERTVPKANIKVNGNFAPALVPYRTVNEVVRLLSSVSDGQTTVSVVQGENQILFRLPDIELVSRLIDGQFPDYKQIIPANFASTAILPRYDLMQAVKSAGLFATSSRSVRLSFKVKEGRVEISAASGDIGESSVQVAGEISGDEQSNTFNYKYILDYLNNITDEKVVFKTINDNSPALISPNERQNNFYVVMPVKS